MKKLISYCILFIIYVAAYAQSDSDLNIKLEYPPGLKLFLKDNSNIDFKFKASHNSKTILTFKLQIDGGTIETLSLDNGSYVLNNYALTAVDNNLSFKYWVQYSDNSESEKFDKILCVKKVSDCPILDWETDIEYNNYNDGNNSNPIIYATTYVYHSTTNAVYLAKSWIGKNNPPTDNHTAWEKKGVGCKVADYKLLDCSKFPEHEAKSYSTGDSVIYNGALYRALWGTSISPPGKYFHEDNQAYAIDWICLGGCIGKFTLPLIEPSFGVVHNVVNSNANFSINLSAKITDAEGLNSVKVFVDNQQVSITNNLDNYSFVINTTSHKTYKVLIEAIDTEGATSVFESDVVFTSNEVPKINATFPTKDYSINYYSDQVNKLKFKVDAIAVDAGATINSVKYSMDGTNFNEMTQNNGIYTAEWTIPSIGDKTVYFKVEDSNSITITESINFTVKENSTQLIQVSKLIRNANLTESGLVNLQETHITQTELELNREKTITLDEDIVELKVRNKSLANISFNGTNIIIKPYRTGRTGLTIKTATDTYLLGVRINNSDGTVPGLPDYVSVGSIFVKDAAGFEFFNDIQGGLKGKNIDAIYKYNSGGVDPGEYTDPTKPYDSEQPQRMLMYAGAAKSIGAMMYYVFYHMASGFGGEGSTKAHEHVKSSKYRKLYYNRLSAFIDNVSKYMGKEKFGIILEPDFLGYTQNPGGSVTPINPTDDLGNGLTLKNFVDSVNMIISEKRKDGVNVDFGWMHNLWGSPAHAQAVSVVKFKDATINTLQKQIDNVNAAAEVVGNYTKSCGINSHGANFVVLDRYGDDVGHKNPEPEPFLFNHDHWTNYMLYAKKISDINNLPMICWQLPLGRVNNTKTISEYTSQQFERDPLMDSAIDFFMGDTFAPAIDSIDNKVQSGQKNRFQFFSQNEHADSDFKVNNDEITWGANIKKAHKYNIVSLMFGHGTKGTGQGIGNPPLDKYYSIQKIQNYYLNNIEYFRDGVADVDTLKFAKQLQTTDLKSQLSNASMFYGKECTEQGVFSPKTAGLGNYWITYKTLVNNEVVYKAKIVKVYEGTGKILSIASNYEELTYELNLESTITLILSNVGTEELLINSVTLPNFLTGTVTDNTTIAAGESLEVTLTFTPTEEKLYTGTIEVNSDKDHGDSSYLINIDVQPKLSKVITASLKFTETEFYVNNNYSGALEIENTGQDNVDISAITVPDFLIITPFSGSLAPNETKIINVTFNPTDIKNYTGKIIVNCNADEGNYEIDVNLNSTVKINTDVELLLPAEIDFGELELNEELTKNIDIKNVGENNLNITGITYPQGFTGLNYSGVIYPDSKYVISVTFSPTSATSYDNKLIISSNKTIGNNEVLLKGIGVQAPYLEVDIDEKVLEYNELSFSANLQSNSSWLIDNKVEWLTITEPSIGKGSNNYTVKFSVQENTYRLPRTTKIIFYTEDIEIVRYLEVTQNNKTDVSISEIDNSGKFKFYPIPAKDFIYFKNEQLELIDFINIYTKNGKLIKNIKNVKDKLIKIDVKELINDMYFVKIKHKGKIYSTKIIIKR